MKKILFAIPGSGLLAEGLLKTRRFQKGNALFRCFPDGERYVRVTSSVKNREAIVLCSLHHPDDKLLYLVFLCKTLRALGARHITLVVPYLPYMRQDRRFKQGESLSLVYFGQLLSALADELVTIAPHLHRTASLKEGYSIPSRALDASGLLAQWIQANVKNPLVIGPDSESRQWVAPVAIQCEAPFAVLNKKRSGDKQVKIRAQDLKRYSGLTPVIMDDIISTGITMQEVIRMLKKKRMPPPVCLGVHGVFSGRAQQELKGVGAQRIITCNTIAHPTNGIDVSGLLADALLK